VYLYEHGHGFIVCQECKLGGSQNFDSRKTRPGVRLFSYRDALKHLLLHRDAGHMVPDFAIQGCEQSVSEQLPKSLCDVPGCEMFSTCSYTVIHGGETKRRTTCEGHFDAAGLDAYEDLLKAEHRRLGKI
jgi:hypothetical protein